VYRRRYSCGFVIVFTWQCRGLCEWLVLVLLGESNEIIWKLERVCSQTQLCQLRCFNDYTRQLHVSAPTGHLQVVFRRTEGRIIYSVRTRDLSITCAHIIYSRTLSSLEDNLKMASKGRNM